MSSKKSTLRQNTYRNISLRIKVRLAELLPVGIVLLIPLSLHAGFFANFIESFSVAAYDVTTPTSVNAGDIKLLSAHNSPDPKSALGGGEILVEGGALVAGGLMTEDIVSNDTYKSGEISLYQVREGDTLSQIAEMFGVTSNTILWANDLSRANAIRPGQALVILPIVGVRHIVAKGDTISIIAKKYKGDVDEILSYNQLASESDLVVGETLVIPGGNMDQPVAKKISSASPTKVTGSAAVNSSFSHPLPGSVRSQGIHGYNAVDLASPVGSSIRAASSGEVIVSKNSGWNGGYGNYVVIKHSNGTQTLYAHMSANYVGVGAGVASGEVIGTVGMTGRSTGAHLHFEVRGSKNPF